LRYELIIRNANTLGYHKSSCPTSKPMGLFSKKPQETAAITYVSNAGATRTIDVPLEDSVMEGAVKNSVEGIVAECGGACMCATCHVYVDPAWLDKLPKMEDDENAMLDSTASERKANSRLSCQLRVSKALDGLIVNTPPTQQ
jgi:2Fe-2S ferredoxin